jgi:hypothetical protein
VAPGAGSAVNTPLAPTTGEDIEDIKGITVASENLLEAVQRILKGATSRSV